MKSLLLPDPFFHLGNGDVQCCFDSLFLVLPDLQRDTLGGEFPNGDLRILSILPLGLQFRHSFSVINQSDTLELLLNRPFPKWNENQYGDSSTCNNEICVEDILCHKYCNGRDIVVSFGDGPCGSPIKMFNKRNAHPGKVFGYVCTRKATKSQKSCTKTRNVTGFLDRFSAIGYYLIILMK